MNDRSQPAFAGDEATMLREFIDSYRATIRAQAAGLSDEQLRQSLAPSDLTLGGLLAHLTYVEDYWFTYVLAGEDALEPWASVDWGADPDWDWHSASSMSHAELDAMLVAAVARADERTDVALAQNGMDTESARTLGTARRSLRWILMHMLEEYARHAGHADLIRQSIDGATDV